MMDAQTKSIKRTADLFPYAERHSIIVTLGGLLTLADASGVTLTIHASANVETYTCVSTRKGEAYTDDDDDDE